METLAFITAVNNSEMYSRCLERLAKLRIPSDIQAVFVPIYNASSMTNAYNKVVFMKGKYKVYLHQDLLIMDDDFVYNMIDTFKRHEDVGILGVVGCEHMSANGIWWEGIIKGRFIDSHTGTLQEYVYSRTDDIDYVDALDGCILCTQYDIPWRNDLFKGWHFYDISQCYEFKKEGYKVGVMDFTVRHLCGICNMNGYEEARQLFVKAYLGEQK